MCHGKDYMKGCGKGSWNGCESYGFCSSAYVGSSWCGIHSWSSTCWAERQLFSLKLDLFLRQMQEHI